MKYRICPLDSDWWKVQRKWLIFWFDEIEVVGYDGTTALVEFADEKLAEAYIDGLVVNDNRRWDRANRVAYREKHVKPREYP